MSGVAALLATIFLVFVSVQGSRALTREVHDVAELRAAMNDSSVAHVLMMRPDGWNFTNENFPPHSVFLRNRTLLLEGEGPGLFYVDINIVQNQVIILDGGNLTQSNVWADDCYHSKPPYACFTKMASGGWALYRDSKLSDASCVSADHSVSIASSLMFIRFGSYLGGKYEVEHLDKRTVLVKDTGWLRAPDVAAYVRLINTSLSCTGNITHMVPPETRLVVMPVWQKYLLLIGGLVFTFLTAGLIGCWRRKAHETELPERRIADARGILLEAPLGSGHFGRVYRGRVKGSGQLVAIKVIDLLPSQRKQMVAACRGCQLMSQVTHDSVVKVVTFFAAQVQSKQDLMEINPGIEYVELGFNMASIIDGSTAADWDLKEASQSTSTDRTDSGGVCSPGVLPDSSSSSMEGIVSTQVHLVMQFCDMGTLDQAVKGRMFRDAETGQAKLRHILLTALDIAQGLEYLHHSSRRMVHRDLSATNILLTTSTSDDRGFRAMLSDFGLTTSLSEEQSHKTSEVKGTISYMSPEMFLRDDVSPALDIYSLGIIMHLTYCGQDPYTGQGPASIILAKVRAAEQPEEARLPLLEGCPYAFHQLVSDCINADRRKRPTAAEVVSRLESQVAYTR